MERQDIHMAVESSLARPTSTPTLGGATREEYLADQRAILLSRLIDPVAVKAVACAWAQQYANGTADVRDYIAIAKDSGTWLLFDPTCGTFAKAFDNSSGGPLLLLGFSSDDVLCEWLG